MTFAPGYDNDIFVSYAHRDNDRESEQWVSKLLGRLDIGQRLGKDVKIWMDYTLEENRPLTLQILDAVRRSAILLIIMSESYLQSQWCARERNAFLDIARECVAEGRVFIVHCRETQRGRRPPEFGDLEGFQFWTKDAKGVSSPLGLPTADAAYYTSVFNLSDRIARKLKEIEASSSAAPDNTAAAGTAVRDGIERVYVARSTEDLEAREDELKSYLTQAGFGILPEKRYPDDSEDAFREAMMADLGRCAVYVQLLSRVRGREAAYASSKRYPVIQHDNARAAGKPILVWREPAVDPATVTDPDQRELLELAQACGFAEFKQRVVEEARPKPPPPPPRPPDIVVGGIRTPDSPRSIAVFVNAAVEDRVTAKQVATKLCHLLKDAGVKCDGWVPLYDGTAEKIEADLNARLKDCDGLVLVYGSSEPAWVREQLNQCRKVQRERDFAVRGLYLGPPPGSKPDIGYVSDVIELDGREGIKPEVLQQFVQKLTATRPSAVSGG